MSWPRRPPPRRTSSARPAVRPGPPPKPNAPWQPAASAGAPRRPKNPKSQPSYPGDRGDDLHRVAGRRRRPVFQPAQARNAAAPPRSRRPSPRAAPPAPAAVPPLPRVGAATVTPAPLTNAAKPVMRGIQDPAPAPSIPDPTPFARASKPPKPVQRPRTRPRRSLFPTHKHKKLPRPPPTRCCRSPMPEIHRRNHLGLRALDGQVTPPIRQA